MGLKAISVVVQKIRPRTDFTHTSSSACKFWHYKPLQIKQPPSLYLSAHSRLVFFQKWVKFKRDFDNFKTQCIPWEMKIKEVESK